MHVWVRSAKRKGFVFDTTLSTGLLLKTDTSIWSSLWTSLKTKRILFFDYMFFLL